MAHMKPCTRRIWEHIEYIILLFFIVFLNTISVILNPIVLPFLFDFSKIVFHLFPFCAVIVMKVNENRYCLYIMLMCKVSIKVINEQIYYRAFEAFNLLFYL